MELLITTVVVVPVSIIGIIATVLQDKKKRKYKFDEDEL